MLGNGHVPFLGGGMVVTASCYPTAARLGLVPPRDVGEAFGSLPGRHLCASSRILPGRGALDAGFASPDGS